MGTNCSCLQEKPETSELTIKSPQTQPVQQTTELQYIYNQTKLSMSPELHQLFEKVINNEGEFMRQIKLVDEPLNGDNIKLLTTLFPYLPKISQLTLKGNELGVPEALQLSKEIHHLRRIRKLKITRNEVEDQGIEAIVNSVNPKYIEQIILAQNGITRKGAASIGSLIPEMKRLEYLWIQSNSIGRRGVQALVEGATQLPQLKELIFDLEIINDSDLEAIQEQLPSVILYHEQQQVSILENGKK